MTVTVTITMVITTTMAIITTTTTTTAMYVGPVDFSQCAIKRSRMTKERGQDKDGTEKGKEINKGESDREGYRRGIRRYQYGDADDGAKLGLNRRKYARAASFNSSPFRNERYGPPDNDSAAEITILRQIPDHVDGGVELLLRRHASRCERIDGCCALSQS